MRTREQEVEPLINLSEITEVELLILKRMREFTIGEHSSMFHGTGFDYVGLRDWQAGDRFEHIDWPQSSLNNFSPLVVREFEQPTTSSVVMVVDRSASTRCGANTGREDNHGLQIATLIARAIATVGMSAVFFQDSIGMIAFDEGFHELGAVRPRIGKGQVIHCLEAYQHGAGLQEIKNIGSLSATFTGFSRKTAMKFIALTRWRTGATRSRSRRHELSNASRTCFPWTSIRHDAIHGQRHGRRHPHDRASPAADSAPSQHDGELGVQAASGRPQRDDTSRIVRAARGAAGVVGREMRVAREVELRRERGVARSGDPEVHVRRAPSVREAVVTGLDGRHLELARRVGLHYAA